MGNKYELLASDTSQDSDLYGGPEVLLPVPSERRRRRCRPAVKGAHAVLAATLAVSALFLAWTYSGRATYIVPTSIGQEATAWTGSHRSVDFNTTLGFQEIYVLNLPKRVDRRADMALMSRLYNLDFTYMDGIDGKMYAPKGAEDWVAAQIGSARAHQQVWIDILHRKLSSALILEDDIDFDVDLRQQLALLQEPLLSFVGGNKGRALKLDANDPWSTDNWDMLWLGTCREQAWDGEAKHDFLSYHDPYLPGPGGKLHRKKIWKTLQTYNVSYPADQALAAQRSRVIQKSRNGQCLAGYALSQRGAQKLLYGTMHSTWDVLDNHVSALVDNSLIESYSIVPPLISQSRFADGNRSSDIHPFNASSWKNPAVPGKDGHSLSIRTSARAAMAALLDMDLL